MISSSPKATQSSFIRDISSAYGSRNGGFLVTEGSETPDFAGACDSAKDELSEDFFWFAKNHIPTSKMQVDLVLMKEIIACAGEWGLIIQDQERKKLASLAHEKLGRVIGLLIKPGQNVRVMVFALAFAMGLDELEDIPSQAEIARQLKVTRQLISHYVLAWSDLLGLVVTKFRKRNATRQVYQKVATSKTGSKGNAYEQARNRAKERLTKSQETK